MGLFFRAAAQGDVLNRVAILSATTIIARAYDNNAIE